MSARAISGDRLLLIAAFALAGLGLAWGDNFDRRLLSQAAIYAAVALGYRQIFGRLNVFSLAQGAFFGLGAYALAILLVKGDLPLPLAIVLACILPALLAAFVALPLLRLESHYLALASLGLAQILLLGVLSWQSLTGGANGLGGIAAAVFGAAAAPVEALAVILWLGVALAALSVGWAGSGIRGLRQQLLRDAPFAAAALGFDGGMMRLGALVLGAALAGLAGAAHALVNGVVSPDVLELTPMILCLSIVVIGGRNGLGGIVIAALLLTFLPEWLRWAGPWYLVAYAGGMLVMLIVAPGGLGAIAERLLPGKPVDLPPLLPLRPTQRANGQLQVVGLAKRFGGVAALTGVDLAVASGEIVGLIGANGAGKTSLLNAIGGQIKADAGSVALNGQHLERLPAYRRARCGLARIFQAPDLAADMTAIDAVALADGGGDLTAARRRALGWLERLGPAADAGMGVAQLGVGARRRIEIARALMQDPTVLLLDEPTAGLSKRERATLASLLIELRDQGRGILIVEHDVAWLGALTDRIYCIDQGRVVASGPPAALRARTELARFFGVAGGGR